MMAAISDTRDARYCSNRCQACSSSDSADASDVTDKLGLSKDAREIIEKNEETSFGSLR